MENCINDSIPTQSTQTSGGAVRENHQTSARRWQTYARKMRVVFAFPIILAGLVDAMIERTVAWGKR